MQNVRLAYQSYSGEWQITVFNYCWHPKSRGALSNFLWSIFWVDTKIKVKMWSSYLNEDLACRRTPYEPIPDYSHLLSLFSNKKEIWSSNASTAMTRMGTSLQQKETKAELMKESANFFEVILHQPLWQMPVSLTFDVSKDIGLRKRERRGGALSAHTSHSGTRLCQHLAFQGND